MTASPVAGDDDARGRARQSGLDRIGPSGPLREGRHSGPRDQRDGHVASQERRRKHYNGDDLVGFSDPQLSVASIVTFRCS